MVEVVVGLFASNGFMPHGHCYRWNAGLVTLHVASDILIGLSYVAISITLALLVRRIRNIPFNWMFLAFGGFIIACGATHFMEVWTLWTPTYWLAGDLKALTAFASVATALLLPPLVPRAVALAETAALAEERRRQLEVANRELAELYARVKEVDTMKTNFFANVSHELRTPLSLILGPTEKLLADESLSDGQRRDLEVVSRNARTLLRHVHDLLDVAKLEAGKLTPGYAAVDLTTLVRLAVAHFEALAAERGVTLAVDAPASVPAEVDPDQIQRALLNLLSNAFKFAPRGGAVRCILDTDGREARLVVTDNGPGVPRELREAIFERFRQADGSVTRRVGGTGLGLAIAKEFVELHRGAIAVDDAPDGGARFTLVLPCTAPTGTEVQRHDGEAAATSQLLARQTVEELSQNGGEPVASTAGRGVVLVVEDSAEMNRFVSETLGDEYRVVSAFDGEEGLTTALALRPDLIVSDVMMPRLSGDELLRRLRARPELHGVPVLMLTAKVDDELRVRLLREGAQDYVMKPFGREELRARVANLVTTKRARDVLQADLASQVRDLETLATEVTARKHELRIALDSMRVARDHAERASKVKGDFLSLVSHELRTPLTVIQGYLYMLLKDALPQLEPRYQEVVRKIGRSSTRLIGLVDSLLEYARIENGRLTTQVEPLDLGALVAEVVDEFQPQAAQKGLGLRLLAPSALPPLCSDARLLRLVVFNLVGNALKYTEAGTVEVSLSHRDGVHRLAVRDSGPGISPAQQTTIFEPFEQLEPLRNKHTPGVGLGLALVRQMLAALDGRIELESRVGAGSTFTVILPEGVESEETASASRG